MRTTVLSVVVAGLALSLAGSFSACRSRGTERRTLESAQPSSSARSAPANAPTATPPAGFVRAAVVGAPSVGAGHAVLLVDEEQRRGVPIFVGGSEGLSIELRLSKQRYQRPLTHDLFEQTLAKLDARVHSARVVALEGGTYFAILVVVGKGRTLELDARPSDAIAMALGSGAPIYVSQKVLEQAGIDLDSLADGGLPPRPERQNIAL